MELVEGATLADRICGDAGSLDAGSRTFDTTSQRPCGAQTPKIGQDARGGDREECGLLRHRERIPADPIPSEEALAIARQGRYPLRNEGGGTTAIRGCDTFAEIDIQPHQRVRYRARRTNRAINALARPTLPLALLVRVSMPQKQSSETE